MKNVILKNKKTISFYVFVFFIFFLFQSTSLGYLCSQNPHHSKDSPNMKKSANMIEKETPPAKIKRKRSKWPFIIGGIVITAAVLVLLLKKPGKDENQGPVTTTGWGKKGTGEGEFSYPSDICIDSSGYVYVADSGNNRIQKFTQNGAFVKQWNILAGGLTIYDNTLYAVGSQGGSDSSIFLMDLEGRIKKSWILQDPNLSDNHQCSPVDVAVDNNRDIYVLDSWYKRILKYTANGVLLQTWEGRFSSPTSIVIKNNEVFVSDGGSNMILVFDREGNPLRSWDFYDTAARPVSMAFWGDSYILAASSGHTEAGHLIFGTVCKYDLYGNFLGTTSKTGLSPLGIDVNFKKQKIYVANYYRFIAVLDPF